MKKYILPAVFTAFAMTACTNDEDVFPSNEGGIQTISAEIIQPVLANGTSSRIIVGGTPSNDESTTRPLKWRADDPNTKANEADVIYVYDSKGNAARYVYSEPEENKVGIFTRDEKVGSALKDIHSALCVPSSVGRANDLPDSIDAQFNYASTMMYHRGAENAPMYGTMDNGVLKFNIVTALIELNIENLKEFRPDESEMAGIKIEAFKKGKTNAEIISSSSAKLVNTKDPKNANVALTGGDDFIGLFLQKNTSIDNKVYFPLKTGEYSALKFTIYPSVGFKNSTPLTKTVTVTLNKGENFTIEKKLYSFNLGNMPKYVAPEKK